MAHDLPTPNREGLIPAEVLAAVPGCESGLPPLAVHVLMGGGHNDVRRVETSVGKFVVRRRLPPVTRAGSDAALELGCHRLAARSGLAPRVVAAASDGTWMVMDFVAGNPWQERDLSCAAGVRVLGERLALVHALPVAARMPPLDAAGIARQQLQAINSNNVPTTIQREADELAQRTNQLATMLQGREVPACINHGDLQVANLIGNPPLLIDWEYAQVAAPTYDIACLLTYYPQLRSWQSELLAAAGLSRPADLELLGLQAQLFACLNRLWALANGLASVVSDGINAG
ncbi:MAG: aminoglycoside phosphotransferase family protein [Pseudomonadota bacterium]